MNLEYWDVTWAMLVPGILYASWVDGTQRRVPNWLNAALLAAGLTVQGLFNGLHGVGSGLAGAAAGFALLIVPWLMHGMGAGDVKLMAAIGAWFGAAMTFWAFVAGAVIGGVMGLAMIMIARKSRQACANMNTIMMKLSNPAHWFTDFGGAKSFGETSQLLPYGIPLTIGSIVVLCGVTMHWWSF